MSKSRMAGLFQTSAGNPRFGSPLPTIDPRIMAVGPKGFTDYPSLAQERASNRKHAWTTDGANAPPMSRAIEARARTQPVRQIWVGQKLAANGNQIRIAFPEPCFRGKPSAATVRLMLSPSWRRHPRLQPLFGIRQHDGWTALGQSRPKWAVHPMSAFRPLATALRTLLVVRFVLVPLIPINLVATGRAWQRMVIPAIRLAAILLRSARGLRHADKGLKSL
jgi:hypothetical protein